MSFFSLFSTPTNPPVADISDRIIEFTKNIVVRQDLIHDIIVAHAQPAQSETDTRIQHCIRTYISLENFIVHNEPLVVQKKYSRESLREEIRREFSIADLPEEFRLLFTTEPQQTILLCNRYTQTLSKYLAVQVGEEHLRSIVSPLVSGTLLDDTRTLNEPVKTDIGLLQSLFREVNTALYGQITASFGAKTAEELTKKQYMTVKELYDYDLVSRYLSAVPHGVLERERVTYMDREELEKQAMAVAQEKLQRELAEKAAKDLQNEKEIIEQKVHEQTMELTKEKEELKKAVEKMNTAVKLAQKNEAKLLASVSGLSLGFVLSDADNCIVIMNAAAKTILELPKIPHRVQDIQHSTNEMINFSTVIEQCKNEIRSHEFKAVVWKKRIVRITVSPIFLEETRREYIGSVILIDDVTEAKRLERTKDEFFAIASHELRTPMTAIRGSISVIKTHYSDMITGPDVPRLIDYIDQSSTKMLEIIDEFLNVSRLEQGKILFTMRPFPMDKTIQKVLTELSPLAGQKGIYLKYEAGDTKFSLAMADEQRVRQVLVNLVGNSLKFTEKGGITIAMTESDNRLTVIVTDTGIGISGAGQTLLFRKFQQADENIYTHNSSQGTGLGLYICKLLIERMGGILYLKQSKENEGSVFIFTLPVSRSKALSNADTPSIASHGKVSR